MFLLEGIYSIARGHPSAGELGIWAAALSLGKGLLSPKRALGSRVSPHRRGELLLDGLKRLNGPRHLDVSLESLPHIPRPGDWLRRLLTKISMIILSFSG